MMMTDSVELGFVIKGYPNTGRKVEEESDLSQVYAADLLQSAFMGDAILRLNELDFSTRFGWVTLMHWFLGLTYSVRKIAEDETSMLRFSESDDFVSFRLYGRSALVASSYRPGIAVVDYGLLRKAVQNFTDEKLQWIRSIYPAAFMNPALSEALARVDLTFPE
jgi:hypothetical protein